MTSEDVGEYRLGCDGRTPVRCTTHDEATAARNDPRNVLSTTIVGSYRVSTIFLVDDHGGWDDPSPIFFETMVFPWGGHAAFRTDPKTYLTSVETHRYTCHSSAMGGHREMVGKYWDMPAVPTEDADR